MCKRLGHLLLGIIASAATFATVSFADRQPLSPGAFGGDNAPAATEANVAAHSISSHATGLRPDSLFTSSDSRSAALVWFFDAEKDIPPMVSSNTSLIPLPKLTRGPGSRGESDVDGGLWEFKPEAGNTSQQRFDLAAYVAGLFAGFQPACQPIGLTDEEMHSAIWSLIWKHGIPPHHPLTQDRIASVNDAFGSGDAKQVRDTIQQALASEKDAANAPSFENVPVLTWRMDRNGRRQCPDGQTCAPTLSSPAAVPEPASVLLLGSLLAASFAVVGWRRAKAGAHS